MARTAKKEKSLTPEEKLAQALVPDVEQPYRLLENWCWMQMFAVASLYTGNSINETTKQKKYVGQKEGLIYIATKDIGFDGVIDYDTDVRIPDYQSFKVAPENTSLLCIEGGSAGRKIGFTNQPVCFVNKLCAFAPKGIISKYIYFFLSSQCFYDQFNDKKHGLIGGVSVKELSSISIAIPPFDEQQRIVDRIESLFAKLDEAKEKAQAIVDSFEDRKAAILHKAFTGELTEEWRSSKRYNKAEWTHKRFSDLCDIVRGGSPRPAGDPMYYDGVIPFMKVADITNNSGPYVTSTEYTIKEAGLKKTRMVDANTLLLTNSGATLGVPAICTFQTTFNDGIAAFLNLDPKSLLFFYYFWTSKTQELRAINMGAAQPNLNTSIIGSVEIDVPPIEEQQEIVRVLESVLKKEQQAKDAAEQVIDQIDTMKKSILARAFRGELGTNDPNDESAVELLKRVLSVDIPSPQRAKPTTIPKELSKSLRNDLEKKIIKLFFQKQTDVLSIKDIMSVSSKTFEILDCLRGLQERQIISKLENGNYILMG